MLNLIKIITKNIIIKSIPKFKKHILKGKFSTRRIFYSAVQRLSVNDTIVAMFLNI